MIKKNIYFLCALAGIALALSAYFLLADINRGKWGTGEDLAHFGSYFGGVIAPILSFIVMIILIKTLQEQMKSNNQQNSVFLINFYLKIIEEIKDKIKTYIESELEQEETITTYNSTGNPQPFNFTRLSDLKILADRDTDGLNVSLIRNFIENHLNENTSTITTIRKIYNKSVSNVDNMRVAVSEILRLDVSTTLKLYFLTDLSSQIRNLTQIGIIDFDENEKYQAIIKNSKKHLKNDTLSLDKICEDPFFSNKTSIFEIV